MEQNQWFSNIKILVGGFSIHLMLGTLYCWGNLTTYITSYLRCYQDDLTYADTLDIYISILGVQALTMWMGGMVEEQLGPGWTCFLGGVLLSGGVALSSYATTLAGFIFFYGVCFGLGLGMAYPAPLSCGYQWMPRHKGMVSGFIVSGFGAGAFVFNQVSTKTANPMNADADVIGADGGSYYSEDVAANVPHMLRVLGLCYFGLTLLGSLLLRNPPKNKEPDRISLLEAANLQQGKLMVKMGSDGNLPRMRTRTYTFDGTEEMSKPKLPRVYSINALRLLTAIDRKPKELLKEMQYYHLAICFMLTAIGGLFVAGTYKNFGELYIKNDEFLSMVGSVASICNAAGRLVLWGPIADRFGFQRALLILTSCLCVLLLTYNQTFQYPSWFMTWTSMIFLCYGGNYVVYPLATAQLFGVEHSATNYGMVFVFTGIAAVITIAYLEKAAGGDYQTTILGSLCGVGLVMAVLLRRLYFRKGQPELDESRTVYG
mmetsp:Transcript_7305/g.9755  ORF Transcript_7305/g.9755 Transcript_7305/m.9755 type:complete len:487 (-) Transcript_7305:93-1553(-)